MAENGNTGFQWNAKTITALITAIGLLLGGGGASLKAQLDSSSTADSLHTVEREMDKRDDRISKITDTVKQNIADIASMKSDIQNIKEDVGEIEDNMATKDDVGRIEKSIDKKFEEFGVMLQKAINASAPHGNDSNSNGGL